MNNSQVIGEMNPDIDYTDRLTVKALILNDADEVLIINNGLLPGGGVEDGESRESALRREVDEELGVTIGEVLAIGVVIQYRDFLGKRYVVYGYRAEYVSDSSNTKPQDDGEAAFTYGWYSLADALSLVNDAISAVKSDESLTGDAKQGALFNRMTTKGLLEKLMGSS